MTRTNSDKALEDMLRTIEVKTHYRAEQAMKRIKQPTPMEIKQLTEDIPHVVDNLKQFASAISSGFTAFGQAVSEALTPKENSSDN